MRHLGQAGNRFNEQIQIIGGARTIARVQRQQDKERVGAEFAYPKTTLRVMRNSIIKAGMVVQLPGDELFLVASHSATGEYRTHHLFPTDRRVSWSRPRTKVHPITKLVETDGLDELGDVWVMWERTRREFTDLTLRVAQENYLLATGADVELGDYMDGKLVKRVSLALGIKIVELQG